MNSKSDEFGILFSATKEAVSRNLSYVLYFTSMYSAIKRVAKAVLGK